MTGNLFAGIPAALTDERVDALLEGRRVGGVRLERIVSAGHATPAGQWYDQDADEWVVVLRGRAGLRFADETDVRVMAPGDHVLIPAHRRHRVEWTDLGEPTVWLALHLWRAPG